MTESYYLEYRKTGFLFEIKKHMGKIPMPYLKLTQIDLAGLEANRVLYLNPKALKDMAEVFLQYDAHFKEQTYSSHERDQKIVKAYFKGLSISDLKLMFRLPESQLVAILEEHGCDVIQRKSAYLTPKPASRPVKKGVKRRR